MPRPLGSLALQQGESDDDECNDDVCIDWRAYNEFDVGSDKYLFDLTKGEQGGEM